MIPLICSLQENLRRHKVDYYSAIDKYIHYRKPKAIIAGQKERVRQKMIKQNWSEKIMIREIDGNDIAECVDVIRRSFYTVAEELGFTIDNAPRLTAFATTQDRLLYQLKNERNCGRK